MYFQALTGHSQQDGAAQTGSGRRTASGDLERKGCTGTTSSTSDPYYKGIMLL